MKSRTIVRKIVNKPLRSLGIEVRAVRPTPKIDPIAEVPEVHEEDVKVNPHPKFEPFDLTPYGWLIEKNIKTVLDIGANTGQFAEMIHYMLPHAGIISFEPLSDCYDKLVRAGSKLGDFKAYNFALGNKEGKVPIYRSEFSPSSSLLPMGNLHKEAFPFTKEGSVEHIEVKRLDDLKLQIEKPLLIKIDVQGFEDHVIEGGQNIIEKASVIIVEISFEKLYEGQPLFDKIYTELKGLGFEYHGNWYQNNDVRNGTALQADGIFIKVSPTGRKKKLK